MTSQRAPRDHPRQPRRRHRHRGVRRLLRRRLRRVRPVGAQTCVLSLLVFTGASQFALVGVIAAGGAPLSGAADRAAARHPQHALRPAARAAAAVPRAGADPLAAHLVIDESTAMSVTRESTGRRPDRLPQHRPLDLRALEPVHLPGRRRRQRRSATRAPTGSTPPSAPPSWPCSGRGWPTAATGWSPRVPRRSPSASCRSSPAGVPVLVAGGVALLAGLLTRNAADSTEIPAP